jgi:hypothetical protein
VLRELCHIADTPEKYDPQSETHLSPTFRSYFSGESTRNQRGVFSVLVPPVRPYQIGRSVPGWPEAQTKRALIHRLSTRTLRPSDRSPTATPGMGEPAGEVLLHCRRIAQEFDAAKLVWCRGCRRSMRKSGGLIPRDTRRGWTQPQPTSQRPGANPGTPSMQQSTNGSGKPGGSVVRGKWLPRAALPNAPGLDLRDWRSRPPGASTAYLVPRGITSRGRVGAVPKTQTQGATGRPFTPKEGTDHGRGITCTERI